MNAYPSDDDVRGGVNYNPGTEVWSFSLQSVVKFYATALQKSNNSTISIDCNVGKRVGTTTRIDTDQETINFQLSEFELMDLAAFLTGARSHLQIQRKTKNLRLERQPHRPSKLPERLSGKPEFKIFLSAKCSLTDTFVQMSMLQNRVSCITALTLGQLYKSHAKFLPPELLLASIKNFQPYYTADVANDAAMHEPVPADESHAAQEIIQPQSETDVDQVTYATRTPRPRKIDRD